MKWHTGWYYYTSSNQVLVKSTPDFIFYPFCSPTGENKHYGTPRNPCAPDRLPGGSSSGSAVAVGAGLVDFSLGELIFPLWFFFVSLDLFFQLYGAEFLCLSGTDTGGSVRIPASYCGIFGFRPSHDVISTSGVIPMAQSFDTVGKEKLGS